MKLTVLTGVSGLLLLLVVIGPGAVEARRHHNHGDPGKNEQRRRERQEEEAEAKQWSAAPEDAGHVIDWDMGNNNNKKQPLVQSQVDRLLPPLYPSTDGFLEEDTVPRKPNKGHGGKKKKKNHHHHPVGESADSVSKDQWKRITNYHKSDDDGCATLKCRRRQVCLVDVETGEAECVHRRVLRMKRKMKKAESLAKKEKKKAEKRLQQSESDYFISEDDESSEERRMKEHMENIKNSPEYRAKEELMYAPQPKSAFDYVDRSASKKSEVHVRKANSALNIKADKACTKQDMDEMGRRLLDWFKLLMEDSEKDVHHKSKRNSKKKELRDDDECICQAPVSWEFQQLDGDSSSQLTAEELRDIEDNGYEHCVRPFIDVCDHNHDLQLSQKEWCCCFADILPPCLGAQRRIPTEERNGRSQVLVGAFVPTCDEDGFFEREQCHGSTGQCWCVDRNGHEIHSTRRQGAADCDRYTERYIQENI